MKPTFPSVSIVQPLSIASQEHKINLIDILKVAAFDIQNYPYFRLNLLVENLDTVKLYS